jgi:ubiquinone/menaquinone biosynthesis C-methylase UbiE
MHKFSPHHAERLENPDRHKLLQPQKTLSKFGLKPGMTFVDIGAGTGFFSRAASEIVGKEGIVYALDMSEEMLEILKRNGVRDNMRILHSEEYRLPVAADVADFTMLSTVLHENTDIPRLLAEAARVTKPSGKIVIIEWKKQDEETGPPKAERLGEDELLKYLSGYRIVERGDVTKSHYYFVVQRKKS